MGLTGIRKRIGFAIFFLIAAVFALVIGDHRGAIEDGRTPYISVIDPFPSNRIREQLLQNLDQDNSADRDRLASALARRLPFDPLPFEIALADAYRTGDDAKKDEFAKRVMTYQSRSLAARLHMLGSAEREHDFDEVFEQYEDLMRLRSLNDGLLTEALVGVFRDHGDWARLTDYLLSHPPGGDVIAVRLLNEPISDQELEPIVHAYPGARGYYLRNLVNAGRLERAYEMWSSFSELSDADQHSVPFNQRFADIEALPPFNWNVISTLAEVQTAGGLYVTYFGKGLPLIAEQMIKAPAGVYVLRTEAKGRMPRDGGALAWSVNCYPNESPIADLVITLRKTAEIEMFETEMSIPEDDCEFQKIQLRGRAGEFPKTSRTEIISVEMLPQP